MDHLAGSDMANLTYVAIASLDGYVEDEQGKFDWAAPDEEAHSFVNELERPVGTYLYGRRMYETMAYWESDVDRAPRYTRTTRTSGVPLRKLFTHEHFKRFPVTEPESSASSTPRRSSS